MEFSLPNYLSCLCSPSLLALRSLHALTKKECSACLCFPRNPSLIVLCGALLLHVFLVVINADWLISPALDSQDASCLRCEHFSAMSPPAHETSLQSGWLPLLLPQPPVLARQAMFLFLRRPEERSTEEQETLAQLRSLHPEVDQAYELVQQFAHMRRTRPGEQLNDWLCRVKASKICELQGFLAGVKRDKAAVTVGLTLPQNNGLVEGKVNKLKLMKRMGYGRAEFPLLRQRVLHAL